MNPGLVTRMRRPLPLGLFAAALAAAAVFALAAAGLLDGWTAALIVFWLVVLVAVALAIRLATGPLARLVAWLPYSVRWKIWSAIGATVVLFIILAVNSMLAMDYMHTRLHHLQEVARLAPMRVAFEVDALEGTQHGTLFSLTPPLLLVGAIGALMLGTAIAWSVIEPVRRTSEAMRRFAAGDFSQPLQVRNRDELGELAGGINRAAQDLARLQATAVAEERERALRERIAQVTLAQEEERRRISRELHDDLGPSLAAIGNRVRVARGLIREDTERVERDLQAIADDLPGYVQAIRGLIHDLRPPALDQLGLAAAVKQHADRWSEETGVRVSVQIAGDSAGNPPADATVFRVLQECLSNIAKHAEARRVQILLERSTCAIRLSVTDDGRGFDRAAGSGVGVGLVSMRERAELAGGRLAIESTPGGGCAVVLEIPAGEG